ncbi:cobalt transporter [Nocardia sp. ET3-3]|uniref:Cobalt transporter n=1 Tax=Nocardia terrae TaxID=2675851 RepID=A0A7K1V3B7_9NOCA|nr:CbtA family protein [Nocardia terrae]MVU81115.1 cobalt transporter [Nocardia terrae]
MEKRIIGRGVLLGALGGLLAFAFARIASEPVINRAIDYEHGRDDAQMALDKAAGKPMDMEMGSELFTRGQQQNIGLGFGVIVLGMAMGALFAVVYYLALRRAGRITARNLALLVSGGMFLALYAVPFLKYPANPPGSSDADTIKERTGMFAIMIAVSVLALLAAVWLGRRLAARLGNWTAGIAAATACTVVIAVAMLALPSYSAETPEALRNPAGAIVYPGFPAADLYSFRLYSFAAQLILWVVIGVGFAWLAPRLLGERDSAPAPSAA